MSLSVWPRSARAQLTATIAALSVFAILLARFPPQEYAFYPACPFLEWLGVQCPGCGITRAMCDLMAGRFHEAAEHNAMAFVIAPAGAGFSLLQSYSVLRWNRWRAAPFSGGWVAAAWVAVLIFDLSRNMNYFMGTIR